MSEPNDMVSVPIGVVTDSITWDASWQREQSYMDAKLIQSSLNELRAIFREEVRLALREERQTAENEVQG